MKLKITTPHFEKLEEPINNQQNTSFFNSFSMLIFLIQLDNYNYNRHNLNQSPL